MAQGPDYRQVEAALLARQIPLVLAWSHLRTVPGHCYAVGVSDFEWPMPGSGLSKHHILAAIRADKSQRSQYDHLGQVQIAIPPWRFTKYKNRTFKQYFFGNTFEARPKRNHWFLVLGLWKYKNLSSPF